MKLSKFVPPVCLFLLNACSGAQGHQSATVSALNAGDVDPAIEIADVSVKGSLLGVLMASLEVAEDVKLNPITTRSAEREKAMFISAQDLNSSPVTFATMNAALGTLRRLEDAKFGAAWSDYGKAFTAMDFDGGPREVINQYIQFFKSPGEIVSLVGIMTPVANLCNFVPYTRLPVRDWRKCVVPLESEWQGAILRASTYGATLARGLYFRDQAPKPRDDQRELDTREHERVLLDHFRHVLEQNASHASLSDSERESYLKAWREIKQLPKEQVELAAEKFKALYDQVDVSQLEVWVASELNPLKSMVESAPPEDDVPRRGTIQTSASLKGYRVKNDLTLAAAATIRPSTRADRQLVEDESKDSAVAGQLDAFAQTLVDGLVDHWNGLVAREVVFARALDCVSEPKLKAMLRQKIEATLQIVDESNAEADAMRGKLEPEP